MKKIILISVFSLCITAIVIAGMIVIFERRDKGNELTLYGNVDVRQVDISFRISGKVCSLKFQEGDRVKKGELMCSLEENPYDSLLEESIAKAAAINIELENAKLRYERRMEVAPSGAISGEDLDNSLARYGTLKAALIAAEKAVLVANDNLSYTKVFAPTDGIVLTRIREPGSVVNAATPIYTLSVVSPIWIRAFVDEPNLGLVHYGMKALVYTDIKGGKVYKGRVGFISPMAEFTPKSVQTAVLRTDLVYRLRVYIEDPDCHILQGMPVTVKLDLDNR